MKHLLLISLLLISTFVGYSQDVKIKNNVFETLYSQSLEQPLWIRYRSTNRPTNVNRGTMDFYKEPNVKTSDADDYAKNIYDKGHGAPAASFSDNMENLKQTFSYLNCILQDQYLNRGEWRLLEEQERRWDDTENLTILITLHFDNPVKRIPTNAAIPSYLEKHIFFEGQKKWRCFVFLNERPKFKWEQLEKLCEPNEHNK
ncbi:DNA/RNA non-specific endonuclease [archaeon]|nr:DNA/RNA non-specific endonuclease [archaeon]NDB55130.1 DNA/RNA non-specific endonuclease [archaeon]NDB79824.1 DNA/RNA non-specific endonuclease [archaeon]